jgi:hypothetical protein
MESYEPTPIREPHHHTPLNEPEPSFRKVPKFFQRKTRPGEPEAIERDVLDQLKKEQEIRDRAREEDDADAE